MASLMGWLWQRDEDKQRKALRCKDEKRTQDLGVPRKPLYGFKEGFDVIRATREVDDFCSRGTDSGEE